MHTHIIIHVQSALRRRDRNLSDNFLAGQDVIDTCRTNTKPPSSPFPLGVGVGPRYGGGGVEEGDGGAAAAATSTRSLECVLFDVLTAAAGAVDVDEDAYEAEVLEVLETGGVNPRPRCLPFAGGLLEEEFI